MSRPHPAGTAAAPGIAAGGQTPRAPESGLERWLSGLESWHWQRRDPLGPLYGRYPLKLLVHDQVGLDLGSRWIKYAVVRHGAGRPRVIGAGGVPLARRVRGELGKIRAQVGALLSIRERVGRAGERWVVGISGPGTMVRTVEVPRMPRRELEKAVHWQAQKKFPFPLEDAHVAIRYIKSRPDQPVVAVVAAAIKRQVQDILYLLSEAEIQPAALTLPAFGLASVVATAGPVQAGEFHGVIELGASRSLFAVYRGAQLDFFRELDAGTNHVERALAENAAGQGQSDPPDEERLTALLFRHGLSDAESVGSAGAEGAGPLHLALERLVLEIQSTLEYYAAQSGGLRINTFYLLGGGARIPGIQAHLAQALEIPVQALTPAHLKIAATTAPEPEFAHPATWAGACGYALLSLRAPNLLPREYLENQEAQVRSFLWRSTTGTALAIALILTGAEFYRADRGTTHLLTLERQFTETQGRLDAIGVRQIAATLTANRRWLAAISRPDLDAGALMRTVAGLTPGTIAIDRIDVHPADSGFARVSLVGEVRTRHAQNEVTLADFVRRLEATGWMQDIMLTSHQIRRRPEYEQITFSLSLRVPLEVTRLR